MIPLPTRRSLRFSHCLNFWLFCIYAFFLRFRVLIKSSINWRYWFRCGSQLCRLSSMLTHQTHPLRNYSSWDLVLTFRLRLLTHSCLRCTPTAHITVFPCIYNSYTIVLFATHAQRAQLTRTEPTREPVPKKRIESGVRVLIGSIYENPLVGMNRPLPKGPFWAPREDPKTTGSYQSRLKVFIESIKDWCVASMLLSLFVPSSRCGFTWLQSIHANAFPKYATQSFYYVSLRWTR